MNKKKALNILKIIISVILCLTATASALGATAVKGARKYFSSEDFENQVEELDLTAVTFTVGGKEVTVSEYVSDCAEEYLNEKSSIFSKFTMMGAAVDKVLSSETVNKVIKEEALDCVNFFLKSDRDEAKERMKKGEKIEDNENLDPQNAKNPIEAVEIYVRAFILANVEKNTGVSCDKIIVLLSEKTASILIAVAVISAILLLVINLRTVFNMLLYTSGGALVYGAVIKIIQSKFGGIADGNEDMIGVYFLTPFVDSFSSSAVWAFVIAALSLALFVGVYFLFKNYVNNENSVCNEKTPE